MSLVLTMREGHDFYVGDNRVVVDTVNSSMDFILRTHDNRQVQVGPDSWTQVYEGVRIQAGVPRDSHGALIRAVVDAPNIKILRGDLYNQLKANQ